jgi:hypothetical protein
MFVYQIGITSRPKLRVADQFGKIETIQINLSALIFFSLEN